MATATVVKAWSDGSHAYLAVRVNEPEGAVEYIGRVALAGLPAQASQRKAALVAAVKAVRDAQSGSAAEIGIAGTVTL